METQQINIVQVITETINNLFSNLFSSVDNSLYTVLDDLLFIGPDLFNDSSLGKLLGNLDSGRINTCLQLSSYWIHTILCMFFITFKIYSFTNSIPYSIHF